MTANSQPFSPGRFEVTIGFAADLSDKVFTLDSGRVWCEVSVESCTVWVEDEDVSPVDLSRRLLEESPRFALNAQEDVLNLMLYMVTKGMLMLRSAEVGVYSLSPVRAEGYSWDPEGNRLTIHAVSALWTLAAPSLRGEVAPLLYAAICRRYYLTVLGRFVETDLQRQMESWRGLSGAEAEGKISEAVLTSFKTLADRFPAEHYQSMVSEMSMDGVEAGVVYRRVCREMMSLAGRQIRGLRPDRRLRI